MSSNPIEPRNQGWQVTVPATSANLGCAFDCAGLALRLYLKASFVPLDASELTVEYAGRHPERVPLDDSNLVLEALRFAAANMGAPPPRGHVALQSDIPVGAGLGSSAAAVVAGLLLGASHSAGSLSPNGMPDPEKLIGWTQHLEGHFDNAAAALFGGLVFGWNDSGRIRTIKTAFPENLKLILVVPEAMVRTSEARRVLPQSYSRGDALHNLQRAAMLAASCFSGRFDFTPEMFDDRLHQPFRQELVPGIARCLEYRHPNLRGIAIGGSGPSVIAIAEQNENRIALDLQAIFAGEGLASETIVTSADNQGAVIVPRPVPVAQFANVARGAKV